MRLPLKYRYCLNYQQVMNSYAEEYYLHICHMFF